MREEDARCKGLIQGLVGIEQCPSIFVDRSARSETNGGGGVVSSEQDSRLHTFFSVLMHLGATKGLRSRGSHTILLVNHRSRNQWKL